MAPRPGLGYIVAQPPLPPERPDMTDRLPTADAVAAPQGAYLPRRPNLRCLGDVPVADGRRTRRSRFLRAPALTRLDPTEVAGLTELDPALIVDFRGQAESAENPVDLPEALAPRRVSLSIEPSARGRFDALFAEGGPDDASVEAAMQETYRDYVRHHADTFARFVQLAVAAGDRPVMFHCTAGKDRTGFAAALLLAALGAERADIEANYLATNGLWRPEPNLESRMPISARAAVFSVRASYLDAALEELERRHGGPVQFVRDAVGDAGAVRDWAELHLV